MGHASTKTTESFYSRKKLTKAVESAKRPGRTVVDNKIVQKINVWMVRMVDKARFTSIPTQLI